MPQAPDTLSQLGEGSRLHRVLTTVAIAELGSTTWKAVQGGDKQIAMSVRHVFWAVASSASRETVPVLRFCNSHHCLCKLLLWVSPRTCGHRAAGVVRAHYGDWVARAVPPGLQVVGEGGAAVAKGRGFFGCAPVPAKCRWSTSRAAPCRPAPALSAPARCSSCSSCPPALTWFSCAVLPCNSAAAW